MNIDVYSDEIVLEVSPLPAVEVEVSETVIEIETGGGSGGNAVWGSITGELSDQQDLAAALAGKSDTGHDHDGRYYTEAETDSLLAGKSDTGHDHDGRYYTEAETDSLLAGKSDTGHDHDGRYYTEAETDTLLAGKSDTGHDHDGRYYTEAETDTLLSLKSDTGHDHDGRYYTETETDSLLSGKSDTGHDHDGRYYTEAETDTLLAGKSDTGHDHDGRYYTEAETDSLLSLKSDTGHDHDGRYYTEAETDSLLSLKSDTGHDHDGRYYTEAETDGLLAGKQATLTFDAAPTAGSANPVTSGGIKTALDGKMPANPIRIEFTTSPTDPFGGYIDFHYAGSSADYTARIIETANYVSLVGKKLSLVSGPLETQFGGTGGSDTGWQAAGVTEGIPLAYTGTIYYRKIGIFVTVIAQDIKLKTALPSAGSFVTLCRMPAGICSIVNTSEWTLASVTDPGIVTLKSSRDVSFNCGKNQGWPVTWGISFTLSFIAN